MLKKVLTVVVLSISCINASENRIENQIIHNVMPSKYTQNLIQSSQQQLEIKNKQKEQNNSWMQSCWNYTSNIAKGTLATLAMAYVVVPIAVDGLWTLALSEGTASKCARSVLKFFKPSISYITTNFVNHFFKLI